MKRYKPKLGQTLYALNINNQARGCKQTLTPVEVIHIGRLYFDAIPVEYKDRRSLALTYSIATWHQKSNHASDYCLYESPEQWNEEMEIRQIARVLETFERSYNKFDIGIDRMRIAYKAITGKESINQ